MTNYPPELHPALSTLAKIEQSLIIQDDTPSGVSHGLDFSKTHPHVDLESGYVYDQGSTRLANTPLKPNTVSDAWCPQACDDALVAFAMDVRIWWEQRYDRNFTDLSPCCDCRGYWRWEMWDYFNDHTDAGTGCTKLSASIALIIAVASALQDAQDISETDPVAEALEPDKSGSGDNTFGVGLEGK